MLYRHPGHDRRGGISIRCHGIGKEETIGLGRRILCREQSFRRIGVSCGKAGMIKSAKGPRRRQKIGHNRCKGCRDQRIDGCCETCLSSRETTSLCCNQIVISLLQISQDRWQSLGRHVRTKMLQSDKSLLQLPEREGFIVIKIVPVTPVHACLKCHMGGC